MDVFTKFIIENKDGMGDCLIMAKCTYHKQLVTDKNKVKGGGWWTFNRKTLTFTLFGDSTDFGKSSFDDIKKCVDNDLVFSNRCLTKSIAVIYNFSYRDECGDITELKNDCLY
jgi:hypothetical protein